MNISTFFTCQNGQLEYESFGAFLNKKTKSGSGYYQGPNICGILKDIDGNTITARQLIIAYAQAVVDLELYEYPMGICVYETLSQNDTRDLYNECKVLLYHQKQRSCGRLIYFLYGTYRGSGNTPMSFMTTPTRYIDNNKSPSKLSAAVYKIQFRKDAQFFIAPCCLTSYVIDSGYRLKYEDGKLEAVGMQYETEEIENTIICRFTNIGLSSNGDTGTAQLRVYESSYPDESDPYVSKILEFSLVE